MSLHPTMAAFLAPVAPPQSAPSPHARDWDDAYQDAIDAGSTAYEAEVIADSTVLAICEADVDRAERDRDRALDRGDQ